MVDHLRKNNPRIPVLSILLGIILILGAVSCRAQADQEPAPIQEEEVTAEEALDSPEPTVEVEDEVEEVMAAEVDQCLACHTDQQALIDTASPVEQTESESSGEG
jgi:hypothetical protein